MNNDFFNRFGGFMNFRNQLNQFQQNLSNQGINPQQKVQELLNSGQMSQQQFEQLRQMANQITGKNN